MTGLAPHRVSLTVMGLNEAATLAFQVERTAAWLARTFSEWEILVVDDGSTDDTPAIAARLAAADPDHVRVLTHPRNLGMGAALRTGYAASRLDWVGHLAADAQIPPQAFEAFVPHLDAVPLVLSRFRDRGDGPARRLLSAGFHLVGRVLVGHPCDFTGVHLVRRDLLARTTPSSDTFFYNLEMPLGLLRQSVPHVVVTVDPPEPRRHGSSKVTGARRIARVVGEMWRYRRRRGEAA
jgi:dolichol-phosphate mannosyltransferase